MPATNRAVENGSGESSIVTFRVPTTEVKELEKRMQKRPVVGIRSVHQYSRKLFLDFIHGKVVYLNPTDMSEDPAMSR
jgi:hypothetical protein